MRKTLLMAVPALLLAACASPYSPFQSVWRGQPLSTAWSVAVSPAIEYVDQPRPRVFGEEISRYVAEGVLTGAPVRDVAWRFDGTKRVWDAVALQSRRVQVPVLALGQYSVTGEGVILTYRLVNESGYVLTSATELLTSGDDKAVVGRRLGVRLADDLRAIVERGGGHS
ncbi:MAG: hypothetical protein NT159_07250 [Proteobacteria bacterium]|nr:hypothetical protein [Pseudomonadota bacterium]